MKRSNRRYFCRTLLGGSAALTLASNSLKLFGQSVQGGASHPAPTKITDNFHFFAGAGANVLLVTTADGSLLVDGGDAEHSESLMKTVAELSGGRPVKALFNTRWRLDSTGSNDALGKTGAKIIAYENTRLWMGTEFHVKSRNGMTPIDSAMGRNGGNSRGFQRIDVHEDTAKLLESLIQKKAAAK